MSMIEQVQMIAERIAHSFPSAELISTSENNKKCFEIRHNQRLLIEINLLGLNCYFPTRYSGVTQWSDVKEGGPNEVAESIIRRLADAGFEVFTASGERIRKTPVRLGKFTICPKCDEMGAIKTFQYGKPRVQIDLDKYVLVGRYIKLGDPQILCTACDWTGLREDVRFTKKRKKTR
jgi:hypothetical protein